MFFKQSNVIKNTQDHMVYANHVSHLEQKDIERAATRLFSSDDGQKILAWLQVMTFQRVHAPSASDEQLRYMEGQRAMVATLLRLVDRGRHG